MKTEEPAETGLTLHFGRRAVVCLPLSCMRVPTVPYGVLFCFHPTSLPWGLWISLWGRAGPL